MNIIIPLLYVFLGVSVIGLIVYSGALLFGRQKDSTEKLRLKVHTSWFGALVFLFGWVLPGASFSNPTAELLVPLIGGVLVVAPWIKFSARAESND